jgi:hypothetical protein
LWSGVVVLGEVADQVIEVVRTYEDSWFTDLRCQLEPAREKRREAERLLEEAKSEEWLLHKMGQWIQLTSDDSAFRRQPHPSPSPPPAQFSTEVAASVLERPWHVERPWKGEGEQPPTSWQELSEARRAENESEHVDVDVVGDVDDVVDHLSPDDETGIVQPLDEGAAA